jgi:hypothetical protein
MPDADPADRYAALRGHFPADGEDRPAGKRGFGASALTIDGRIFAMMPRDRLVVKLPRARVDALVADGWGVPFDANRGRPMKEWLVIDPAHENDWLSLAEEARAFVGTGRRR